MWSWCCAFPPRKRDSPQILTRICFDQFLWNFYSFRETRLAWKLKCVRSIFKTKQKQVLFADVEEALDVTELETKITRPNGTEQQEVRFWHKLYT